MLKWSAVTVGKGLIIWLQIGVARDCWGCGRTVSLNQTLFATCEIDHVKCEACKSLFIKQCRICKSEYCILDDDGCTSEEVATFASSFPLFTAADVKLSVLGAITVGDELASYIERATTTLF